MMSDIFRKTAVWMLLSTIFAARAMEVTHYADTPAHERAKRFVVSTIARRDLLVQYNNFGQQRELHENRQAKVCSKEDSKFTLAIAGENAFEEVATCYYMLEEPDYVPAEDSVLSATQTLWSISEQALATNLVMSTNNHVLLMQIAACHLHNRSLYLNKKWWLHRGMLYVAYAIQGCFGALATNAALRRNDFADVCIYTALSMLMYPIAFGEHNIVPIKQMSLEAKVCDVRYTVLKKTILALHPQFQPFFNSINPCYCVTAEEVFRFWDSDAMLSLYKQLSEEIASDKTETVFPLSSEPAVVLDDEEVDS